MLRFSRWMMSAALAVAAVVLMAGRVARADDTAATAPSTSTAGSVVVTVVDGSGAPVPDCSVSLRTKEKPADGSKPAKGKTDTDGKYTFSDVAAGDYIVMARVKGSGAGHEKVTVADGSTPTAVTVTLKAGEGKPKKDKTPPSDTPAPPADAPTPPAATQPAGN